MALVDNKGKLFGKFNIIDLLIVLFVLLIIGGGYTYLHKGKSAAAEVKKIQYDIEMQLQSKEFVDMIKKGDEIRDGLRNNYLGKVIDIKPLPAITINENIIEGKYVKAETPGMYDVVVTLEADAVFSPGNITVNSVGIKVGKKLESVKGKGYASQCYILGIRY